MNVRTHSSQDITHLWAMRESTSWSDRGHRRWLAGRRGDKTDGVLDRRPGWLAFARGRLFHMVRPTEKEGRKEGERPRKA